MPFSFFLTNKFLKSKRDSRFLSLITLISIAGISIGVAVVIISIGVLQGFENSIRDRIVQLNSHIKITAFGNINLQGYETTSEQIKNELGNNLKDISPFVSKMAVVRSDKLSEGFMLNGILPDDGNVNIKDFIIAGSYDFTSNEGLGSIIVGKKLTERLSVGIGDTLTIFTLRKDKLPSLANPPGIEQFRVSGIYESGMAEYDDLNGYIDLKTAQELFSMDDAISGMNIKINDVSKIDSLTAELQDFLRYPHYVRSIFDVHRNIFTWLDLQKEPIPIVLGLIILVAVFNIVGTLLMIVLERTNTVGVLKSLGATRNQILKIFVLQGGFLGLIGILFGNILAFLLSFMQNKFELITVPGDIYFMSQVHLSINIENYIIISFITFFLCIIAAVIPSYIASRINPITAIKFS